MPVNAYMETEILVETFLLLPEGAPIFYVPLIITTKRIYRRKKCSARQSFSEMRVSEIGYIYIYNKKDKNKTETKSFMYLFNSNLDVFILTVCKISSLFYLFIFNIYILSHINSTTNTIVDLLAGSTH